MGSRLLITGGTGLLALNWAMAVQGRYDVVLGLHARTTHPPRFRAETLALASSDEAADTLARIQPSLVVHTAGMTNVEACEADAGLAYQVNVVLPQNLATACRRHGVPLVHISTDHLFSGTSSLLDETTPVAPLNAYGRTKAEAEMRVLEVNPAALVIRTNFYGWGTTYRSSFSDWVLSGLRARKIMTLFGDVHYSPILAEVLVRAVHELVAIGADGIFHVVGDERISKLDFGRRTAAAFGLDASSILPGVLADRTTGIQRPKDMSLSNAKLRQRLGRNLGGVTDHLARLRQQEDKSDYMELKTL